MQKWGIVEKKEGGAQMRKGMKDVLVLLFVGGALLSVIGLMITHPRTPSPSTSSTLMSAEANEAESRYYNDNPLMRVSSLFGDPVKRAEYIEQKRKEQAEIGQLNKISHSIPMKLISGAMPLTLYCRGIHRTVESVFGFQSRFKVTNLSVITSLRGRPEVVLTLFLSPDKKGDSWISVATSLGGRTIMSKPIDKVTIGKRTKLVVETGLHPGVYGSGTISVNSFSLDGVRERG